jgi:hypothetical protein
MWLWNFCLVVVDAVAAVAAHLAGVPWAQIALLFGGLLVLVVVSIALVVFVEGPRGARRHALQLEQWRAISEARLREPQRQSAPTPAIEAARVIRGELVDVEAVV